MAVEGLRPTQWRNYYGLGPGEPGAPNPNGPNGGPRAQAVEQKHWPGQKHWPDMS
jgi:hypothetical protein